MKKQNRNQNDIMKKHTNGKHKNGKAEPVKGYDRMAIKKNARIILEIWQANRGFQLQDTRFEDFEKASHELDELMNRIEDRGRELQGLKSAQTKLLARLALLNTRARSGMRGYFGPQSPEFARIKVQQLPKAVRKAGKPAAVKSDDFGSSIWIHRNRKSAAAEETPVTPPEPEPAATPKP